MPFTEQELILAQEVARLAIWEWHVEEDRLRWLPGSVAVFGRPLDELRQRRDVLECVHPEDRDTVNLAVEHALNKTGNYEVEYRVQLSSGVIGWIHARGRVAERPGLGKVMIGVAQDVTEAKSRQSRVEAQARLLDLAYEPILVRDAEDRITYWNNGAERLYGYSFSEAAGVRSHDLLRTTFPESLRKIELKLEKYGHWEGELIHSTKDNRLVHVASRWQRFSNVGISTLETNFDLSQQKALQAAKLWEQKVKLLGEMSHKINNPLTAATSAAYMLRSGCDKPVQRYIEVLEESINQIARFIRDSNELHETESADEHGAQKPGNGLH